MSQAEVRRRQAEALAEILTWITLLVTGYLTGSNGVTYIVGAYGMFMLIWLPVGGELSDALGRLLRNRYNKGQYRNAEKMQSNAMLLQLIAGGIGSILLFVLAQPLTEGLLKLRYSALILMVLAPTVFLRGVSHVFLGYFQGQGSEFPTAVADIMRQLLILGFGSLFAGVLKGYGNKVSDLLRQENFTAMYSGVGISIAAVLAELLVILFLFIMYKMSSRGGRRARQESGMRTADSFVDYARYLYGIRWSGIVTSLLLFLPIPLGLLFFGKSVQEEDIAASLYGVYAGRYLVVCGILASVIMIMVMPVIGKGFKSLQKEEKRFARSAFQSGLHVCMVQSIFFVIFVAVTGQQLAGLLCPDNSDLVQTMFQGGSAIILTTALTGYFARLLSETGRKYIVMGTYAVGDVLFAVTSAVFLNFGKSGILAIVYSGLAAGGVCCVVMGVFACAQLRLRIDWMRVLIVPVIAGVCFGVVNVLIKNALAPHLGNLVTLLVVFVVSSAIYWAILLLARDFREHELEFIPGGKLLNALGQMLHVF